MIPRTPRANVRILLMAGAFACLMATLTGCSRLEPHQFVWEFSKQEQITQAFIESVQEYYSTVADGELGPPNTFPPEQSGVTVVKFVHTYKKQIPGKRHEVIKLMFWDSRVEVPNSELTRNYGAQPFFAIEAFDYAYDNIEDAYMPDLIEAIAKKMRARNVAVKRR